MPGGLDQACLEYELTITIRAIDPAVVPKFEVDTRMAKSASAAIAAYSMFFNFNDFGWLEWHKFLPDPD